MKEFTFKVPNVRTSEITVKADNLETAKNRLKNRDIEKEVNCNNAYDFNRAELVETRELPSQSKILSFQR